MTINYNDLKDLSSKDIQTKIRSGEIVVPGRGTEERERFLEFAASDKDSRQKFIDSLTPEDQGENEGIEETKESSSEEKPIEPVPEEPKTKDEQTDTSQEEGGEQKQPSPWWSEDGFGSEEEVREALKKKNELIDRFNAERGKYGLELKKLKEGLSKGEQSAEKKPDDKEKDKPQKAERPLRPKRPNPSDYDDGIYDDKYLEAVNEYDESMVKYESEFEAYITNKKPEWYKEVEEVKGHIESDLRQKRQNEIKQFWAKMYDNDIPELQKEYGLKTSVPVKDMSEAFSIMNNPSADESDKTRAKIFISGLPKKDLENYDKIRVATECKYDFSTGKPVAQRNTWAATIIDYDLKGYNKVNQNAFLTQEEKQELEKKQTEQNEEVIDAPRAANQSQNDGIMHDSLDIDDVKKEFVKLQGEYALATKAGKKVESAFERTTKFKRYCDLRVKLYGHLPSSIKKRLSLIGG